MRAAPLYIVGADRVIDRLNGEIRGIKGRSRAGMAKAGLIIKQVVIPITPKRKGNLRNSFYNELLPGAEPPVLEVGFRADYAPYVHEIWHAHYTTEGTGWKFLERALAVSHRDILEAIREHARIIR